MELVSGTLPSNGSVDLVGEFAEPWCLAAAEIVTSAGFRDRRQRLLAVQRPAALPPPPPNRWMRICAARRHWRTPNLIVSL